MRVDGLPADQRAVIQLILTQGRSYAELAEMLRTPPETVRDRAHGALHALAGERAVPPDVADYLLGQQDEAAEVATRDRIAGDREVHGTVVALVRLLAGTFRGSMPQIPLLAPVLEPEPEPQPAAAAVVDEPRTSLLGGALLIAVVIALAAAAVWWAVGRGDDDEGGASVASTPTPTATQATGAAPIAQLALSSALGGEAQGGIVFFAQQAEQNSLFFQLAGGGLPANAEGENYGVWIVGGGPNRFLGFAPPVGEDGALTAAGPGEGTDAQRLARWLDAATRRGRIVVTRETSQRPARPGQVVLSGRLSQLQRAQPEATATPSP